MSTTFRLSELAQRVDGRVIGDPDRSIRGVETLDRAGAEHLSFLTNVRYRKLAERTAAGALLVPPDSGVRGHDLLETPEPYLALARLLELFHPAPPRMASVSADARIADGYLEFRPFNGKCRFSDCMHLDEPDCAIRAAVDAGEIEPTRYASYRGLVEELGEHEDWEI